MVKPDFVHAAVLYKMTVATAQVHAMESWSLIFVTVCYVCTESAIY